MGHLRWERSDLITTFHLKIKRKSFCKWIQQFEVYKLFWSKWRQMMSSGGVSHGQEVDLVGQQLLCWLCVSWRSHSERHKPERDSKTDWKPQYLTGGSSVHVPPQPASYWSRDSQLVGGEVLRLLRVCRRKQSVIREELMWQNSQLSDECGVKSTIFPCEMWSSRSTSNRNTLSTRTSQSHLHKELSTWGTALCSHPDKVCHLSTNRDNTTDASCSITLTVNSKTLVHVTEAS